ncbi:Tripartite tricarboxylate transporter family receptor [Caballeronia sordidicola]|uniref:Tripartite tricarboxylate transporter family receptor n=1 Tax=Caballeronia sordidicola TaxID=196367 RepID=A0A158I001_CABSO|nr:tripartite tricarboxylate transporter substrate binding protein [Caballeronia sordidicola]SAL49888.1 Tripartite tricarboxylate transporter family receptor [Caballeronia sordidicola]
MKIFRFSLLLLSCVVANFANAQDYPTRQIRMFIPASPGGGVDLGSRIIAARLSETLGKPVVAENHDGAGTILATELLAHSKPDGYTILMVTSSFAVNPAVRKMLPFDPNTDFTAVAQYAYTPDLLVVNAQSNLHSVADVIAEAKKKPGDLAFSTSGSGTLSELEPTQLKTYAGIDMLDVPYRGGIPAVTGLMGNQTNMLFLGVVGVAPLVKAGKLRAIAATGKSRARQFPDVPTMAESGFPDWDTGTWYGVLVPAKTPPAIVALLNKQINDALRQPDVRTKLAKIGLEPRGGTPEQFSSLIRSDMARWQQLVLKNPQLRSED